jgi:hypothetical protein
MNVYYKPYSRHKHSVRVTPSVPLNSSELLALQLPDLYITHDVLQKLNIPWNLPFTLLVTFDKATNLTQDKENTNDHTEQQNRRS